MEKQQPSEEEQRRMLCKDYLDKLAYLQKKTVLFEEDVTGLLRGFFRGYLGVQYSFTYQELEQELAKRFLPQQVKKNTVEILESLTVLQFSSQASLSQDTLRALLSQLSGIITALVPEQEQASTPFIKRLFVGKSPQQAQTQQPSQKETLQNEDSDAYLSLLAEKLLLLDIVPSKKPAQPAPAGSPPTKKREHYYPLARSDQRFSTITSLIERAYEDINGRNVQQAKKRYKDILKLYDALSVQEQSHCFLSIEELYHHLRQQ